jgi:hypothetical protein
MNDEELIKRLRMVTGFIRFETGDRIAASACLSEEAAERIEALLAQNAAMEAQIEAARADYQRESDQHDDELNRICDERVSGPFVQVTLDDLSKPPNEKLRQMYADYQKWLSDGRLKVAPKDANLRGDK